MRIWIDTEFNDYRGELISMALVADDGREWYEVLECNNPSEWVAENVMPVIGKIPLENAYLFSLSLESWLSQFDVIHVVSDWPEDIAHFCNSLIIGPGDRIKTPPLTMEIKRDLPFTADISSVPHNALADARALRNAALNI